MYLAVFLIEVILIFFYLTWEEQGYLLEPSNENYSSYYTQDIIGNDVVKFPIDIDNQEKLNILKKSELINQIMQEFPNVEAMSEIFEYGVEDESGFKEIFLNYMQCHHREYIGVEITEEVFRGFILNPQNLDICE
jgi:hypothetical protein